MAEKAIDTWIELAPDGRLQGHYVLHEPERTCRALDAVGTSAAKRAMLLDRHSTAAAWCRLQFCDRITASKAPGARASLIRRTLTWHACFREKRVTS